MRLLVNDGTDALAAHLHDAAGLFLRLHHAAAVADLLHHGLLAVDILAGIHGVDGDFGMPVVGRGDEHGIDIRPRQHLAIIARGEKLLAPTLFGAREPPLVDVGDRHQFDARHCLRRLGVAGAHTARADQRHADTVVGGNLLLLLVLSA